MGISTLEFSGICRIVQKEFAVLDAAELFRMRMRSRRTSPTLESFQMQTRAAVAFAQNAPLEIVMLDLAKPGPDEVLVQMKATGLCHSDLSLIEGKIGTILGFPVVPGHEGAGLVVEVGSAVTSLKPGDTVVPVSVPECGQCANCTSGKTNVCLQLRMPRPSPFSYNGQPVASFTGTGTFAEYSVIAETRVAKVRSDARADVACYVGCGVLTGVGAVLDTAKVTAGSSVAIFGLGGIGLCALEGARISGATKIVAIDINPAREAIARAHGATHFINPREVEDVVAKVREITGGGADYTFECVGNVALLSQAIDASNPFWGTVVSVGIPGEGVRMDFDPGTIMTGRKITGSLLGGSRTRTTIPRLVDWHADGVLHLDDLITHRLTLDEINKGFDMMKSGEAIRSVVIF